jgi:predicted GTPase
MNDYRPKIAIIGGIETGKTSTIQMLWEESIYDYCCQDQIHNFSVSEMVDGRDIVDFEVYELPRINYTSDSWIDKPSVRTRLEEADVILYVLTCDEVAINSRRNYLQTIFETINLKENVVFLIAFGMADWVVFPEEASNFEVPEVFEVKLPQIKTLLKKVQLVYTEFASFIKYDPTFSVASVVPYSNVVKWNLDELKYQIWNGLVLAINNDVFDDSLPTVVLSGKTGCGKTSTINAIWNGNLATSRVASCTKFPAVIRVSDVFNGQKVVFNLVDLPGIAERLEANSLYWDFYYKFIKKASLLLCLTQADRRAYKQDQLYYGDLITNKILRKDQNIVLGINQADLLFKSSEHLDGIDLHSIDDDDVIIHDKIKDFYDNVYAEIFDGFDNVTKDSVVIYSVLQRWHLNNLKSKIYNLIF